MLCRVPEGLSEVRLDEIYHGLVRVLDRRRLVVPRHLVRPLPVGLLEEDPGALDRERRPLLLGDVLILVGFDGLSLKLRLPVL